MICWASSRRLRFTMLLKSRAVHVTAPLVSLRKLSAASAGIADEDAGRAFVSAGATVERRERGLTMEFALVFVDITGCLPLGGKP